MNIFNIINLIVMRLGCLYHTETLLSGLLANKVDLSTLFIFGVWDDTYGKRSNPPMFGISSIGTLFGFNLKSKLFWTYDFYEKNQKVCSFD